MKLPNSSRQREAAFRRDWRKRKGRPDDTRAGGVPRADGAPSSNGDANAPDKPSPTVTARAPV